MKRYAIGLDYGTNSCRSLLIDLDSGEELGSTVFEYPSGELGILTDPSDPNVARQNPQDYLDGVEAIITGALERRQRKRAPTLIPITSSVSGSTPRAAPSSPSTQTELRWH